MVFSRKPKVLLSYRRADTGPTTGRLADRLKQRFGAANVFIDVDNIPLGVDFRDHIHDTIRQCDVVLVMIGPNWIASKSDADRLREPEDHLRIEIETALRVGVVVIPVLVDAAAMPTAKVLPGSIDRLAFLNAARLDTGRDFSVHASRIEDAILESPSRRSADKAERHDDLNSRHVLGIAARTALSVIVSAILACIVWGPLGQSGIYGVPLYSVLVTAVISYLALDVTQNLLFGKFKISVVSLVLEIGIGALTIFSVLYAIISYTGFLSVTPVSIMFIVTDVAAALVSAGFVYVGSKRD